MKIEQLIAFYRALDTDAASHTAYRGTLRALEKLIWQEYQKIK